MHLGMAAKGAAFVGPLAAWAAGVWRRVELPVALGAVLFVLAFLIVSVIALQRARAQDIPETVRALAHLLPYRHADEPHEGEKQSRGVRR